MTTMRTLSMWDGASSPVRLPKAAWKLDKPQEQAGTPVLHCDASVRPAFFGIEGHFLRCSFLGRDGLRAVPFSFMENRH